MFGCFQDSQACFAPGNPTGAFSDPATFLDAEIAWPTSFPTITGSADLPVLETSCTEDDSVSEDFSSTFFLNPFAVNLQGDLDLAQPLPLLPPASSPDPLPENLMTADFPFNSTAPLSSDRAHVTVTVGSEEPFFPVIAPLDGPHIAVSPPISTPIPKSSPESDNTNDTNILHFIDHADKKSALRIRNTRISRAHRDNKLKRIQDLEKRLAASEAERDLWKARALGMGWQD